MNWIIPQTVDRVRGADAAAKRQAIQPLAYPGNGNAHVWEVTVLDNGQPADLTGVTVVGYFMRADGNAVAAAGTVSGNKASVTFATEVYVIPGLVKGVMNLTIADTSVTPISAISFVVQEDITSNPIDPSGEITLDVGTLVADIETAVASIPSDYSDLLDTVADTFSSSTAYAAGDYVWYSGVLYRFTAAHAAGSWSGTDASAVVLANDLADLKSRVEDLPDVASTTDSSTDLYITDDNGNAIAQFKNGHVKVKNFDSAALPSMANLDAAVGLVGNVVKTINGESPDASGDVEIDTNPDAAVSDKTTETSVDLDITDENGNVIARFAGGHIQTKEFDSSDIDTDAVKTVNHITPDSSGNVDVAVVPDPQDIADAVDDYLVEHPVVAAAAGIVSVADYGAVGDGVTDDSAKIQAAVDANYDVYFESNKTYFLASTVTIDHDIKLHGGENTVIKTATPSGGEYSNTAFSIGGTLKKTTTLTGNYTTVGGGDNAGNRLQLADMTGISIGDIIVVEARDQYYSPVRNYYYLGGTLSVVDVYDNHVYVNISMPWDITNSANVSAKVYSAPTAIVENLNFVSDLDSRGHYRYALNLTYNNGSVVRNCSMIDCDCDLYLGYCVNVLVDNIRMAHSKYDNSLTGDGYGFTIRSSTNTVVQRIIAMSGQHTICFSGGTPVIDTYIRECEISAECRVPGINEHDIAYNVVIEDCTLGGLSLSGPTTVNRCRIIKNNRLASNYHGIMVIGTENPEISDIVITNCKFDGELSITITSPSPQDPIRSIVAVVGSLRVENCEGGMLRCEPGTRTGVTADRIDKIIIRNWQNCKNIIHKVAMPIGYLEVVDTSFTDEANWVQENSGSISDMYEGIAYCNRKSNYPAYDRLFAHLQANGMKYNNLPADVPISFSSSDTNGHYIVCGENLASNVPGDYTVGSLTSNVGSAVSWSDDAHFASAVSVNASGNLVYTMPSGYSNARWIKLRCMAYANEKSIVKMTCKLKNTGATSAASFKFYAIVVDPDTGLITSRYISDAVTATAEGATLLYTGSTGFNAGSIVLIALYNSSAVADAETTIEDFVVKIINPSFSGLTDMTEGYNGTSRDGDGTLMSVDGVNYVMATSETFSAKFRTNLGV